MPKFFVSTADIHEDTVTFAGENVNHMKNVLRLKPDDTIIVCDGEGMDYVVRLTQIGSDVINSVILTKSANQTEPPIEITLFQGIPKSDKMDFIIQKSVELGVHRIVPVMTERTVVRFENQKDQAKKTERWQKIVLEAAKQCNRGRIPRVELPVSFRQAVQLAAGVQLAMIPYEKETGTGLKGCLQAEVQSAAVYIGPEGGFSENEITQAREAGIVPVTLGPRILRTETAGVAVLSILMYELGDVGR